MMEEGNASEEEVADKLEETSAKFDPRTISNFEGKTLLHLACCMMPVNTVRLLVERYEFDVTARDNDGNMPLHEASRCDKAAIVRYLISRTGCDINAQNFDGNTALHNTMMCSHWSAGRVLLTSPKLKVMVQNDAGETPINLLEMQLLSPECKKMKKELLNHVSVSHQAVKGQVKSKHQGTCII